MHSDPRLVARIEATTETWRGLVPKKTFGGMAWLLNGDMCVGVWHDNLVVRCDPQDWPDYLNRQHVREMDITGRSMKGWLLVAAAAVRTSAGLRRWLEISRTFVSSLPAKQDAQCPPQAPPDMNRPSCPRRLRLSGSLVPSRNTTV